MEKFICPYCGKEKTVKQFVKSRWRCRACDRRKLPEEKKKTGRKPPEDMGTDLILLAVKRNCIECGSPFDSINGNRQCSKCKESFKGIFDDVYDVHL